jgi:hypothetical protein
MAALEKHYSPQEVAKFWGLSPDTIRKLFQDEPGVLKVGEPSRRLEQKLKRSYITLRIPEALCSGCINDFVPEQAAVDEDARTTHPPSQGALALYVFQFVRHERLAWDAHCNGVHAYHAWAFEKRDGPPDILADHESERYHTFLYDSCLYDINE